MGLFKRTAVFVKVVMILLVVGRKGIAWGSKKVTITSTM